MRTTTRLSPGGARLLGAVLALAGLTIVLVGLGVIPTNSSDRNAPAWILVCAGLEFCICATMAVNAYAFGDAVTSGSGTFETRVKPGAGFPRARMPRLQDALALGFIGLLAVIDGWIAFGPGPRTFAVSGSFATGAATSKIGRAFFGVMFVPLFLSFVLLSTATIDKLRKKP